MKHLRLPLAVCFLFMFMSFFASSAFAVVDADAAVVKLRTSCQEGGTTLNNCFTTMADLQSWINTRQPTEAAPLSVEIGPGSYGGLALGCGNTWGHTTFRGAGRDNTRVGVSGPYGYSLSLIDCTSMVFMDMTIGPLPYTAFGGINWKGTGTSSWKGVDVFTNDTYGWQDVTFTCPADERGAHYWFSSRIVSTSTGGAARPYISRCSEDWFFGSEVTINPGSYILNDAFVLRAAGPRSEIHFYAGVLRLVLEPGITVPAFDGSKGGAIAVAAGGQIHIHGTGMDLLSTEGNHVTVLGVSGGGMIHANESANNISVGEGGSLTRISNNGGHIHAPYLWEHLPDVPNFTSVTGADMTTITDTPGNHPHIVVYDTNCPSSWFDTTVGVCMP